jgi:hypothetical protein
LRRWVHSASTPFSSLPALLLPAAFLTHDAVALLVEKFNIMPADTAHAQLEIERMLAGDGEVARGR